MKILNPKLMNVVTVKCVFVRSSGMFGMDSS